jgi:hypothetical protein
VVFLNIWPKILGFNPTLRCANQVLEVLAMNTHTNSDNTAYDDVHKMDAIAMTGFPFRIDAAKKAVEHLASHRAKGRVVINFQSAEIDATQSESAV